MKLLSGTNKRSDDAALAIMLISFCVLRGSVMQFGNIYCRNESDRLAFITKVLSKLNGIVISSQAHNMRVFCRYKQLQFTKKRNKIIV